MTAYDETPKQRADRLQRAADEADSRMHFTAGQRRLLADVHRSRPTPRRHTVTIERAIVITILVLLALFVFVYLFGRI